MEKKKSVKTKKKKSQVYEDSWIYILLLSAVVILQQSLKNYTFIIDDFNLSYSLFLLPVIYFLTNYITKKKGYQKSIMAISISAMAMVIFVVFMNLCMGRGFELYNVAGDFCGYFISQLINLTIYEFLLDNTKPNYILLLLTYIFALVVNYLFYSLFYISSIAIDNYWVIYFTTLILQTMLVMLLAFIDMQIKRGK
ncbi:MAG: hypothetical protein IKG58_02245 [Bacilli bacterium]|nr:hypothetical protein [Bacilli bacterium]